MKNMVEWGFYNKLRPRQIDAITKSIPIAYLPWGAIEYHGHHNPIGLDSIKAHNLCMDLAKKVGGLVLPVMDVAANLIKSYSGVNFKKYSIEFSEKLIQLLCVEYLEQLAEQDIRIIVLLSGHAGQPHLDILKKVASQFNKKHLNIYCLALTEFDILPDELLVANHSALGETSLQLYYAKETVDLTSLPENRGASLEIDAVSGEDPRLATANHGKKIASMFVENAIKEINILKEKLKIS